VSFSFGMALKCFRRSLECQLSITSTDVNHVLMLLLERCGNCCLFILKYWDKKEQYSSELETDEKYDFELRKALLNSSNRANKGNQIILDVSYYLKCIIKIYIFNFNVKDLNLIPTSLNNSKESMLSVAEHCYSRALTLETNINDKNNLSIQIGNVYNENIKMYMEEISSKLKHNSKCKNVLCCDFYYII